MRQWPMNILIKDRDMKLSKVEEPTIYPLESQKDCPPLREKWTFLFHSGG